MYFLPFNSRTRFVAFRDTPEIEERLGQFLLPGRSWEQLNNNPFLFNAMHDGDARTGVFFKRGRSFVTNSAGNPQVEFVNNPKSLLFSFGSYKVASSSGSFSYDNLNQNYVRIECF